jgi:hypothetical protein
MTAKHLAQLLAVEAEPGKSCPAHSALVDVLKDLDKRLRRVELVGIIILAASVGGLFKGPLVEMLLKMLE